jgi:predicted membrane channel-forming protein YqfA (hemolysin III family)
MLLSIPIRHVWLEMSTAVQCDLHLSVVFYLYSASCSVVTANALNSFALTFLCVQLFHVAVVVAACVHYKAVRIMLAWRDESGGCLLPEPLANSSLLLPAA